jgi:hypothetical protein
MEAALRAHSVVVACSVRTQRGPALHVLGRVGPSHLVPWLGLAGRVNAVRSRAVLSFSLLAI